MNELTTLNCPAILTEKKSRKEASSLNMYHMQLQLADIFSKLLGRDVFVNMASVKELHIPT